MNPFLSFLIFVPLLVSGFFVFDLLLTLVQEGPKVNILFVLTIMSTMCGYLVYIFGKSLTREWAQYDVPGENLTEQEKRSSTNYYVFFIYFVLVTSGLIFFSYESMKGTFGVMFFVMGASLIRSSITVKRTVKETERAGRLGIDRGEYKKQKTLYIFMVICAGLLTVFFSMVSPSWHFISPWDISGVLFYLACTCVWVAVLDGEGMK